ncbi:MAG TPA: low molecular weight phosphotyrosine protein phosphatase [Thiothrix sp.]|nr:low molecular weight phosphotyrosine protein phosphatase [Thiothrix sp.]
MFNNVLMVCVGNICRSPMAEYLLKDTLPELNVFSAGLSAVVGKTAEKTAMRLMQEKEIDMSDHCAQQLNTLLLSRADLVLVMEQAHLNTIHHNYPAARGKVFLLGKWINNKQIVDPYQKGEQAFQDSLHAIEASISGWQNKIWRTTRVKQRYAYS